jgi:BirA family biotin operon repressor/biotin-[acetyl-CoA-carboxylase] ligase
VSIDVAAWLAAVGEGVVQAVPRAGAFAQHVSLRPTTGSTNDDVARAALEGAPEGYTVIAAEQTAGRGRRGSSWHSPAAHGLYLSTLLRPDRWAAVRADPASPASSLVTLMAGVAVASAIRDVGDVPVELKWPNDVMVRTPNPGPPWRKLAGILAEGASDGGVPRTVVVGIGVNLHPAEAPDEVAARMIALDQLLPVADRLSHPLVQPLVAALLVRLREGTALLAGGLVELVRKRWLLAAPSALGTRVRWQAQGTWHEGDAAGIDASGALRVRVGDRQYAVHGGDVAWLLEDGNA